MPRSAHNATLNTTQPSQAMTQAQIFSEASTPAANAHPKAMNKTVIYNQRQLPPKPPVGNYKNWKKKQDEAREQPRAPKQQPTHKRGKSETKRNKNALNRTTV